MARTRTNTQTFGTIRASQLIYHYGPGSIADLKDGTIMPLVADKWKLQDAAIEMDHRITNTLNINHVKLINNDVEKLKVSGIRFPQWQICPNCGMMTQWERKHCYYCEKDYKKLIDLYPSRFIIACYAGHIDDFPYVKYVHKGKECMHATPLLKMKHLGKSGSLSDIMIECVRCNQKATLAKIMEKQEMKKYVKGCNGKRPWLEDHVKCAHQMETHLRGATYLYSPSIVSFLKIPLKQLEAGKVESLVMSRKNDLLNIETVEDRVNYLKIVGKLNSEEIDYALNLLDEDNEIASYESIRKQEWRTLTEGTINDMSNTTYKATEVSIHKKLKPFLSQITRIDSMPEIKVLQGFSRMSYSDRFEVADRKQLLPVMNNKNNEWLPGIKNIGEGIFIKFNERAMASWESSLSEEFSTPIRKFNDERIAEKLIPMNYSLRHMLIHTFSHALIEEFSAHSGYPTTSLQERMYCNDDMNGVLIYTASGDAEGSLGGLINLAASERFYPIVVNALERVLYCSSDPLCSDLEHGLHSTANGAACHSCSYLSEVSCEWGNVLLDRRLLRTINPHEKTGYFDKMFEH